MKNKSVCIHITQVVTTIFTYVFKSFFISDFSYYTSNPFLPLLRKKADTINRRYCSFFFPRTAWLKPEEYNKLWQHLCGLSFCSPKKGLYYWVGFLNIMRDLMYTNRSHASCRGSVKIVHFSSFQAMMYDKLYWYVKWVSEWMSHEHFVMVLRFHVSYRLNGCIASNLPIDWP